MRYTKSLKGSVNFKRVLRQGSYVSGKRLAIYIKKNNILEDENRLGICVSKKHGNSVTRNKLKRWAREAYHSFEKDLLKKYNIVILYRKDIEINKLDFNAVKDEMRDLFIKNELLHG